MSLISLALFALPMAFAQTPCSSVGVANVLAQANGSVPITALPACVGHLWQPITWNPSTFVATQYQLVKLVQYSPNSVISDNNAVYRTGNMASTSFDQAPVSTWPVWNATVPFNKNQTMYLASTSGGGTNLRNEICTNVGGGYVIKGMYAAFPAPFRIPTNPTIAELDNYHVQTLRHMRRVMQISKSTTMSPPTNFRAHWFSQVNYINSGGICTGKDGHCGGGNFTYAVAANLSDFNTANPGLCPDKPAYCTSMTQLSDIHGVSEGVSGSNPNIKLSIQFQNTLCMFLQDGLGSNFVYQAHNGPIGGRPHFGVSVNSKTVRVRWTGSSLKA